MVGSTSSVAGLPTSSGGTTSKDHERGPSAIHIEINYSLVSYTTNWTFFPSLHCNLYFHPLSILGLCCNDFFTTSYDDFLVVCCKNQSKPAHTHTLDVRIILKPFIEMLLQTEKKPIQEKYIIQITRKLQHKVPYLNLSGYILLQEFNLKFNVGLPSLGRWIQSEVTCEQTFF